MTVNINECFVAINGANHYSGMTLCLCGFDAGYETNNEHQNDVQQFLFVVTLNIYTRINGRLDD